MQSNTNGPFTMTSQRPATISQYIDSAPREGQPHLHRLHAILKSVAPEAAEAIKWGNPFFVEPRFLFAFSAFKAHLNFAPTAKALAQFREELGPYKATQHMLQVRYDQPLPEALIRRIAAQCVEEVAAREDDGFW